MFYAGAGSKNPDVSANEKCAREASAKQRALSEGQTETDDSSDGGYRYVMEPSMAGSAVLGEGEGAESEERVIREESDFGQEIGGSNPGLLGDKELSEALLPEADDPSYDPDAPMSLSTLKGRERCRGRWWTR